MKKILLLSTIAAASLYATNGDNLIGLGAESRALGGTGIAMYQGSENAMTNPALLGKTKDGAKEFTVAATLFKADVSVKATNQGTGEVSRDSDVGISAIPYISHAHRLSNTLTFGFGLYGTAGMGVDYEKNDNPNRLQDGTHLTGLYNMKSELQLLQIAPSVAYNKDNYGIGVTAILQYGTLAIDYDTAERDNTNTATGNIKHIGDNDSSSDTGFGLSIGGYYDISSSTTIAAVYKSAIDMEYGTEISDAAAAFGYGSHAGALDAKPDHLEQPAEIGFGFSTTNKTMTYTADYKIIKWADAKGYKDFGWEDQKVIALGAKYKANSYWLGLGYNSSNNPIPNNTNATSVAGGQNTDGHTMNALNYVMFPGTITKAYTLGGGYNLGKDSSIDLAYTHMPEVSDTVSAATVDLQNLTTTHSQNAVTIAYKFNY